MGGGALLGTLIGKGILKDRSNEEIGSAELAAFDTNFIIAQAAKIETVCKLAVEKSELDDFIRATLKDYRTNIEKLDGMIGLSESLKQRFPKLEMETLVRNRRILENAAKRLREVF